MAKASAHALLRKLEWRVKDAADSMLGGEYRSAFRGRGREFDQVVKYEFGDDIRDIDWNVTARLGEPYRKKFIEEREMTIVLLFEDSLSLQFGSGERTKRDALLEMAGLFALLSASNRDRVGFWHATPEGHIVREPVRGRTNIVKTAANLLGQPIPQLELGGEVSIGWKSFYHAFPRHSLVIWLGDHAPGPVPPGWNALRRRYEVIGVRADDPWDRELPADGLLTAVDPLSGDLVPFDTGSRSSRRRHAEWVQAREKRFTELFPAAHERLIFGTGDDLLDDLVRFFKMRMKMLHR